jgi:GntR family transcriptional regulator
MKQRKSAKREAPALRGPRYLYIHAVMRDWIYQGRYRPGSQLPTEDEICRMFGVSRITTRKALALLADERLIVRNPGRGTFVTEDLADAPVQGDMEQLLRKVRRLGSNTQISAAKVEMVEADPDTARDLRLAPGSRVQRAAHVRLLDGKPIGYCETFIPADLKIRFSPTELNTQPMLTLLERKGVDIGWGDQLVGATLADARFSRLLDVPVGAALVRVRLVVFDTQQRPVERLVAYYRGDHYDHHIRLTRGSSR